MTEGFFVGWDSIVGIATHYWLDGSGIESHLGGESFCTHPDWPWAPPNLPYNECRVISREGGCRVARAWH